MDIFHINETQTLKNPEDYAQLLKTGGFLWLDATHDEVCANPEEWRNLVEQISGTQIYDLHLKDVRNLSHPSYFDATQDYEMVVFRKLTLTEEPAEAKNGSKRKIPAALNKLATTPVAFLLMENVLVTVRPNQSRTVELARQRLLEYKFKGESATHGGRLPSSPEELMLRLLNAMVDQYLELRQPLTQQLDRWQHALLDPRRPFNNWMALTILSIIMTAIAAPRICCWYASTMSWSTSAAFSTMRAVWKLHWNPPCRYTSQPWHTVPAKSCAP